MKPLPEEKLLKLIRGKGRPPAGAVEAAAPQRPSVSVPSLPWPSARARLRYGTRVLILGLGCLLAVEFILLIVQAMQPPPRMALPPLPEPPGATAAQTDTLPPMPSLTQGVSRPLFAPSADTPGASSSSSRMGPS